MITVTFYKGDRLALGIKTEFGILDVEAAASKFPHLKNVPLSVSELISKEEIGRQSLLRLVEISQKDESLFLFEDSIHYGPSVPEPKKIIAIGLNYKKHAAECNLPIPTEPIIANKFNNTIHSHGKDILLPAISSQVDYEAELAIIIGKKARNVTAEDALSVVYGYSCANDVTARDLQNKTSQWTLGKSIDGFCPIGPYLVSREEIENPNNLKITSHVNGEIRQDSNTSDMVFNCQELIAYISKHFTLEPGDIILTGTPDGVILGAPKESRVWLKDGDVVTIEVEKIGRLMNTFSEGKNKSISDAEIMVSRGELG